MTRAVVWISVDVETSGPAPGTHAILSLGACVVGDDQTSFYAELQPDREGVDPAAVRVSGLSVDHLRDHGEDPSAALRRFVAWVDEVAAGARPVFVALNAPFDWMFVADALQRHVGRNPFGHSALDLKALHMGMVGGPWTRTSLRHIAAHHGLVVDLPHHALADARLQGRLFATMLAAMGDDVATPAPAIGDHGAATSQGGDTDDPPGSPT